MKADKVLANTNIVFGPPSTYFVRQSTCYPDVELHLFCGLKLNQVAHLKKLNLTNPHCV